MATDGRENWEIFKRGILDPIANQLSFLTGDKNSFSQTPQEKNNISFSFEDIIYKNPAFTVEDMERYQALAEEMENG